jgi:hypothetical protein
MAKKSIIIIVSLIIQFFSVISFANSSNLEIVSNTLDSDIINVGFMENDNPTSFMFNQERKGIAVDLFKEVATNLKLNINYIGYHDHLHALNDLKNNNISVLLGTFSHDPSYEKMGLVSSSVYFIDEDIIVAPQQHVSFNSISEMIWTDLLKQTIYFSFIIGIIVWLLLLAFEGSRHAELKEISFIDKVSYTFFQVWACFLRDLIYNPATNSGRILMSMWMFFSILMITIVTSILTSTIIILTSKSHSIIQSSREMHFKDVGYIQGNHSSSFAITAVGAHAVPYEYSHDLLNDIKNNKLHYAVVGKTMLEDYLFYNPKAEEDLSISNVGTNYEGWILLFNSTNKIYSRISSEMVKFIQSGSIYSICSKYVSYPEYCLVI